ncbi:MAG: GntR family transcriptional regulator [Rhodoglobus sp.]
MTDIKSLGTGVGLQRENLKDKAVEKLRGHVISGIITPGTALVERDIAELLGISRGPTREALLELEMQGLVENVRGRRKVISPSTMDIVEMFEVRTPLEARAAERAALKVTPDGETALRQTLEVMQHALERRDRSAFVLADLALHEEIWRQSANAYLEKVLRDLSGPIFLAIVNGSFETFNWEETYELHRALIDSIASGDATAAGLVACRNMDDAIHRNETMPH